MESIKLTSKTAYPSPFYGINLAHITAQTKLLDAKTITHDNQNPHGVSTIVVEFVVLGALLGLLLLWRLQVHGLCVVLGERLGVEGIHQALLKG